MQINAKNLILILIFILTCIITYKFLYSNKKYHMEKYENVADSGSKFVRENSQVFDNAVFYNLDLNTTDELTGYPKCLQECKGACVQYGLSGSSWCIPNDISVEPTKDNGIPNQGIPR